MRVKLTALLASLLLAAYGCSDGESSADAGGVQDGGGGGSSSKPMAERQLLEACARLASCGVPHARLADCVSDYVKRRLGLGQAALFNALYECVNDSDGDCKAIRQCAGYGAQPQKCDRSFTPHCEGNKAVNCDLLVRWKQSVDCAKGGLTCAVKRTGSTVAAVCGGGKCPAGFRGDCRDNRAYRCVGGAIEIDDCPMRGLQCRDDKAATCEGTGRSCPTANPSCSKDTLVSCIGGYLLRRRCADEYGRKKCSKNACVGSGTACKTGSDFDSCDGDALVVCVDGYKQRVDCKKMGFAGCEKKQSGFGAKCKAKAF